MTSGRITEGVLSAPASPMWLLRSRGPVCVRSSRASGRAEVQRVLRCPCGRDTDWLLLADPQRVVFVCRCGRRTVRQGLALTDVIGLVEEEPMLPQWAGADEAVRALGFAPRQGRGPVFHLAPPHLRFRLRLAMPAMPGLGRRQPHDPTDPAGRRP
ncbi:MAG TPA: hypothetical protein VFU73_03495 [Actinocrinis sp.]|nr:hypothetical protein [Actinocrinis sp.]